MITIDTDHDNEGSTSKIENWLRSSTKVKMYKMMDSLQSVFPFNHRIFLKFKWNNVRRIGLDAFIISFCENLKICDYVQFSKKSFVTSIMYHFSVETTLLVMMPLLPM